MLPIIYIIIPVFNRWHFTKACLESLYAQTYTNFKIVVVDDGSTDSTPEHIRLEYPQAQLLHTTGDLFWSATTNVGIRWALEQGAEWVLTLNNDTLCLEGYLQALVDQIPHAPNALQGSVAIEQGTGKVTYAGERHNWLTDGTVNLMHDLPVEKQIGLHRVTHFPGRGLLIPRQVIEKIGLFDEKNLPHYLADYDFTRRAHNSGIPVYVNFEARLITYPEASGEKQLRENRTLANYWQYITGMRGGANLRDFYHYSRKNCPWYLLPSYLLLGFAKRSLGYLVRGV